MSLETELLHRYYLSITIAADFGLLFLVVQLWLVITACCYLTPTLTMFIFLSQISPEIHSLFTASRPLQGLLMVFISVILYHLQAERLVRACYGQLKHLSVIFTGQAKHLDSRASPNSSTNDIDGSCRTKRGKNTKNAETHTPTEKGYLTDWKQFSVFLPYLWPSEDYEFKLNVLGASTCLVLKRVLNPLTAVYSGLLVNSLSNGKPSHSLKVLVFYQLFSIFKSNIDTVQNWFWLPIETKVLTGLEKASYNHIMDLSCDFHDATREGDNYMAVNRGQSVFFLFQTVAFTLIPSVLDLAAAYIYLYLSFGPCVLAISIGTGACYAWVTFWATKRSADQRRRMDHSIRRKNKIKYDTISNWYNVSILNLVHHSQDHYGMASDESSKLSLEYMRSWRLISSFQKLLTSIGLFIACVLVVYDIIYQDREAGDFVSLISYWENATGPINTLTSSSTMLIHHLLDAKAHCDLWQQTPSVRNGPNKLTVTGGHVVLQNVSFTYKHNKPLISDLNLQAASGQMIALVGESGAGKSSILKILVRFYDVDKGSISIDGQDIRTVTLQSLRDNFGIVSQNPTLFNTTIMENLRCVRPDASEDEIHEACKAAAMHEKILSFDEGYSTKVGERGVKLSGGELQRVAIARAILKNPRIVLLDEATSSVDTATEVQIQKGLKRLCHGRTTFVVAHRLSTVQHADQILVIKEGRIVERGTHSDLLKSGGEYSSLWAQQICMNDSVC